MPGDVGEFPSRVALRLDEDAASEEKTQKNTHDIFDLFDEWRKKV